MPEALLCLLHDIMYFCVVFIAYMFIDEFPRFACQASNCVLNHSAEAIVHALFCKTVLRYLPSSVLSLRKDVPNIAAMKTIIPMTAAQITIFLVFCSMFNVGYTRPASKNLHTGPS